MVEALIISVLGSFIYDHADFFTTANKQVTQGYNWEWNYKDRNPNVPAISLKSENGSEKVIWVLEK
tara:strand:- start:685 stop:882 length:198 start_codon:yes stop_codon:yes gene_type:complete